MSKHTPGPWRAGKPFQPAGRNDNNKVVPIYAQDHGCASCGLGKGEWLVAWTFKNATTNRWKSDAALIAASTEMLDVLVQWRSAEEDGDEKELANARIARDAAIAKATGTGSGGFE